MVRRCFLLAPLLCALGASAQEGSLEILDWEPEQQAPGPPEERKVELRTRTYGWVRTRGGLDTSFDSPRGDPLAENVFDLRARALMGVDARLSERLRLVVEARAFWRVSGQRGLDRTKAWLEPEVGEAYFDLYSSALDLRVGNQVVAFGANLAFAPSDALNPRDLREGWLLGEPEDQKIPAPAVRARGRLGRVDLTFAYFPFFRPSRYAVLGQDEALVQPALGIAPPLEVHESVEDQLLPLFLETERPKALPWLGEVGLRATTALGRARVGASWVWIHQKLPAVDLDPELAALVRAAARGREDAALATSVQQRLLAGERLVDGRYPRQHLLSAELQVLLGQAQLDVDAAYSPSQTLYASDLQTLRRQTFTWVVGVSQARDSPLLYSLSYVGLAVPGLPSEGYLFLLEPATAAGAPRTVWFHALFGQVGYRMLDDRLELTVRGGVEPIQRSFALAPAVSWRQGRSTFGLGLELYQGRVYSPFGYFGRNDQVVVSWMMDLL